MGRHPRRAQGAGRFARLRISRSVVAATQCLGSAEPCEEGTARLNKPPGLPFGLVASLSAAIRARRIKEISQLEPDPRRRKHDRSRRTSNSKARQWRDLVDRVKNEEGVRRLLFPATFPPRLAVGSTGH